MAGGDTTPCALVVFGLLFLFELGFISCDMPLIYGAVSGNVTLSLTYPKNFTEVLWKKRKDKVIEWDKKDPIKTYPPFEGRAYLDTTSGNLTISNLTLLDGDDYEVEFLIPTSGHPGIHRKNFVLEILEFLPAPVLNCSATDGNITVTCSMPESNYTHVELVTYSWDCHSGQCTHSGDTVVYFGKAADLSQDVLCTIRDPVQKMTSSIKLGSCVPQDHSRHRYLIIPAIFTVLAIIIFLIGFPTCCRNTERTNAT